MRPIDADALIKRWDEMSVRGRTEFDQEIMVAPSIDIDRPQGEWIIEIDVNGNTYGRCSICGMRQYAGQLNFCPDCGARMKGVSDK